MDETCTLRSYRSLNYHVRINGFTEIVSELDFQLIHGLVKVSQDGIIRLINRIRRLINGVHRLSIALFGEVMAFIGE